MNYFFVAMFDRFKTKLQVPLFQNRNFKKNNYSLFQAKIKSNSWIFEKIDSNQANYKGDFIILDNLDNERIFFLANDNEIQKLNKNELSEINNFTDTFPAFRSNLKIYLENGGFSSYQSEYPFDMIEKKGSILTPISTLLNLNADKNYLIFKNIYKDPIKEQFNGYFIDIENKKILNEIKFFTNTTNHVEVEKSLIKPEIYLCTRNYLGIPIYLSIKDKHLSCEHTHPPHEYFFGKNKFKNVKTLKERVNEIFN